MKRILLLLVLSQLIAVVSAQTYYRLEQMNNAYPISYCGYFSVDDYGYIFGGQDASTFSDGSAKLGTLYQYTPETDTWSQKTSINSGQSRNMSFAFSIGTKGYIGCGSRGTTRLSDVWYYDTVNDSWAQLNNYGDGAVFGAVTFVIDGVAYAGTGSHGGVVSDDLFMYDDELDSWFEMASIPGGGRWYASSCALNGKGYVMFGSIAGDNKNKDVYEYDPVGNSWSSIESFPGTLEPGSSNLRVFTLNNRAYAVTSDNTSIEHSGLEIWEFNPAANGDTDPATEVWKQIDLNIDIEERFGFYGFNLDNSIYFGGGQSSVYHDDFYKFMAYDSVYVETTICEDEPLYLGGDWRTTTGEYVDYYTNQAGFDSIVVTSVTVVYPTIDNAVSLESGTITASLATADSYQWFVYDTETAVEGATSYEFTPEEIGEYAVVIVVGNCETVSAPVTVDVITALDKKRDTKELFYPNPAKNSVTIPKIGACVVVYSLNGSVLIEQTNATGVLDISSLLKGTYVISVEGVRQKLIVK